MGGISPRGGLSTVQVAVCTIEKANGLVNRLVEEGKLTSDLVLVVVDELHLIGDPHRGYLLELLLTKLLLLSGENPDDKIQIVGMSATLSNLPVLARWLQAAIYTSEFRPIPLTEIVFSQDSRKSGTIYTVRSNQECDGEYVENRSYLSFTLDV